MDAEDVFPNVPISIDEFESHDPEKEVTNAERVLRFLARNDDKAYKAVEIADVAGVDRNSVHPVLKRLREQGLVRHREPYWAVGDLDDVRDAVVFGSTAEFLNEKLGTESREEWLRASEERKKPRNERQRPKPGVRRPPERTRCSGTRPVQTGEGRDKTVNWHVTPLAGGSATP